jgi:hypothetical protein
MRPAVKQCLRRVNSMMKMLGIDGRAVYSEEIETIVLTAPGLNRKVYRVPKDDGLLWDLADEIKADVRLARTNNPLDRYRIERGLSHERLGLQLGRTRQRAQQLCAPLTETGWSPSIETRRLIERKTSGHVKESDWPYPPGQVGAPLQRRSA